MFSKLDQLKNHRSQKQRRAAEIRDRKAMVEDMVRKGRTVCEFPMCPAPAADVHEIRFRSAGGSISDEGNVAALCRLHHDWVHANPKKAMSLKLKVSRYE